MSGPATTFPLFLSIVITTITIPSCARCCLSLRTIFPTSPTPSPSTSVAPAGTFPVILQSDLVNSTLAPLNEIFTF